MTFCKTRPVKNTSQELICNREYDNFISSNEVCRPIPVTFSKFGWAKIRTEKPPIQDTIINFTDRFSKIYFYLSYVPN